MSEINDFPPRVVTNLPGQIPFTGKEKMGKALGKAAHNAVVAVKATPRVVADAFVELPREIKNAAKSNCGDGQCRATAEAPIVPKSGSTITGTASFIPEGRRVKVVVQVTGATPGKHAVHLHEKGDCSAADGTSAGPHWNPGHQAHGHLGETSAAHLGDIGNIDVDAKGNGKLVFKADRNLWRIGGGKENDVVGHSMIIHGGVDDFSSQPGGNAGARAACGVIGKVTRQDP